MRLPSFLSLFTRTKKPPDLPLQTRVAQLEGDVLAMRAQIDSIHTTTRRLQGKVYKGVPLGDTVDAAKPEGNGAPVADPPGDPQPPLVHDKAELYKRAAQLRRR